MHSYVRSGSGIPLKEDPMKIAKNSKGFTLVEIMIVVAIIGLLAAIAVPNFAQARTTAKKNACINNLRLLSGAKDQWALETNQAETADADDYTSDVDAYLKAGTPVCPTDGDYTYGLVSANPTCSKSGDGHEL